MLKAPKLVLSRAQWRSATHACCLAACLGFAACTRNPLTSEDSLPIEEEYQPSASVCYWRLDKKAALTFSFDDARASHWQLAAPILEEKGLVGTFNLDTKGIRDWKPWSSLYERGHEIASHTYSHARLPSLRPEEVEFELQRAIDDLTANIPGLKQVLSFAYPYCDYTPELIPIVARYHLSQRAGRATDSRAINARPVDVTTLNCLKGYWIRSPYDLEDLLRVVDETVRSGGWLIVFWHSLARDPSPSDPNTAPLAFFQGFVDAVAARSDSLWIATQGEIASYIWEREGLHLQVGVDRKRNAVKVSLPEANRAVLPIPLTVRLAVPESWTKGNHLLRAQGRRRQQVQLRDGRTLQLELDPGEELYVWAEGR